jgi:hypothetical protein
MTIEQQAAEAAIAALNLPEVVADFEQLLAFWDGVDEGRAWIVAGLSKQDAADMVNSVAYLPSHFRIAGRMATLKAFSEQ